MALWEFWYGGLAKGFGSLRALTSSVGDIRAGDDRVVDLDILPVSSCYGK